MREYILPFIFALIILVAAIMVLQPLMQSTAGFNDDFHKATDYLKCKMDMKFQGFNDTYSTEICLLKVWGQPTEEPQCSLFESGHSIRYVCWYSNGTFFGEDLIKEAQG